MRSTCVPRARRTTRRTRRRDCAASGAWQSTRTAVRVCAQPRELAPGELARRGDRPFRHLRPRALPFEMRPHLAVADQAHRGAAPGQRPAAPQVSGPRRSVPSSSIPANRFAMSRWRADRSAGSITIRHTGPASAPRRPRARSSDIGRPVSACTSSARSMRWGSLAWMRRAEAGSIPASRACIAGHPVARRLALDSRPHLRVRRGQHREPLLQCPEVQSRAAGEQRHPAGGPDVRDRAQGVVSELARGVALVRVPDVDQPMRRAGQHLGARLSRADVQVPEHQGGVHADNPERNRARRAPRRSRSCPPRWDPSGRRRVLTVALRAERLCPDDGCRRCSAHRHSRGRSVGRIFSTKSGTSLVWLHSHARQVGRVFPGRTPACRTPVSPSPSGPLGPTRRGNEQERSPAEPRSLRRIWTSVGLSLGSRTRSSAACRAGEQSSQHRLVQLGHRGAEPAAERRIHDVAGVAVEGSPTPPAWQAQSIEVRHRSRRYPRPTGDGVEQVRPARLPPDTRGIARNVIEPGALRRTSTPSERSAALAASTASATDLGHCPRDAVSAAVAGDRRVGPGGCLEPIPHQRPASGPKVDQKQLRRTFSTSTWSPRRTCPRAPPPVVARECPADSAEYAAR